MSRKRVDVMITAFRDGFQSVYGARVIPADYLPAVEAAREAGLTHFEAGGGAMFQSLYFYCNENAFRMMDQFREKAGPEANLQTLARGINVVALDSQPADIITLHARLFRRHGISTIRNFDALNDVRNLAVSGRLIREQGLRHEVCITLMALPPGCSGAHDPAFYARVLDEILESDVPFDSLCFKDASGSAVPATVHETVRHARQRLPGGTRIVFHTHDTVGTGVTCYRAAIEAGVDQVDLSLAPCSGGTSQPDVASLWHALRDSPWDLNLDIAKVMRVEAVLKACMQDYFLPPEALAVEPLIPWSPMPGGALTANTQMMRDQGILNRYPEVIGAMGEVVRRGGFGTSVTPVSQFYFQQAFNNVMLGPWAKVAEGYGRMVLGYFGRTPVPPDPDIIRLASEQLGLPPATRSPLDMDNEDPRKGVAPARARLEREGLPDTEENIFIVAACGDKGVAFLKGKARLAVRKRSAETPAAVAPVAGPQTFQVTVDGAAFSVSLEGGRARVNGREFEVRVADAAASAPSRETSPKGGVVSVPAPIPGVVTKILRIAGQKVQRGEPILVLEAMKMEMPLNAPESGTVQEVRVRTGDAVTSGQELARITP
ncbi:MAG: biotin attachment protein [Verrucomicrobiae bacterium]|nr:biotin attachment protein [Verrucomicrobiae bacterium]